MIWQHRPHKCTYLVQHTALDRHKNNTNCFRPDLFYFSLSEINYMLLSTNLPTHKKWALKIIGGFWDILLDQFFLPRIWCPDCGIKKEFGTWSKFPEFFASKILIAHISIAMQPVSQPFKKSHFQKSGCDHDVKIHLVFIWIPGQSFLPSEFLQNGLLVFKAVLLVNNALSQHDF